MDIVDRPVSEEDERKLKNLATRIMSNGVEVLVRDKSGDSNQDQRKLKYMHITSIKPHHYKTSPPQQSLLSSAVATFMNQQQMSALYPLNHLMQHNYIIKTCMTTYTYLTTVVQNKRSAISTFETIVSVVTTESLTNLYATDLLPDIKPTKTKFMELKTIQPSATNNLHKSSLPKINKRVDNDVDELHFDLIEPSESGHTHCTTSCSCSHTKTENLKTKYNYDHSIPAASKYDVKTSKYGNLKLDLRPTKIDSFDKNTQYGPYEYEHSQLAPTDRIVEKYTEVINDYSDEKDLHSVETSELLTNEQGPTPPKTSKVTSNNKVTEKPKPEKPQKPNKNKVLVADLLKLGSLGIKGLSQLAPVFEKMTGGFIKRPESNKTATTSTTTTVKPIKDLTPYNNVKKRIDDEMESKHNNFPIYIPVDELETSESQIVFTNATLHQNLAWAAEHKQPKAHTYLPKMVHESPLVNGGIPISPGEIITANSDVIVGKPAVGGPLTLAASGIKLQNPVNPPPIDSLVAGSEQYFMQEKPGLIEHSLLHTKMDDSYDLRPPEISKQKPNRNMPRPSAQLIHYSQPHNKHNFIHSVPIHPPTEQLMKTEQMKTNILGNHGRPAYLDYIPSLARPSNHPLKSHDDFKPVHEENKDHQIADNSPSSSEVFNTHVTADDKLVSSNSGSSGKPFLVDIQPSKVANVLIPHGSATALVFAGSSEPHKTGDYVDDPLPYPEPGYFGSFSIDAPQMTNVHNFAPNSKKQFVVQSSHKTTTESYKANSPLTYMDQQHRNDLKPKWKDTFKRPVEFSRLPPPSSNQETHVQVGPKITSFNPDIYHHNNGEFEKYNHVIDKNKHKDGKDIIDKEYENYLAVPPPPPPHMHFHKDIHYDSKNKPYNQKPIVHVKPVQDMKVFLNIQHPIPDVAQTPPKVTSEIYFASQAPNSKPSSTYTIHMPPTPPINSNMYTSAPNNNNQYQNLQNANSGKFSNSFSVIASPNFANESMFSNSINDKDNTYTVTLNTAANVANNVGDVGQVIGSSMQVPVGTNNNDQLDTDIPIGTNFAIKVEDEPSPFENYHLQSNQSPPVTYNKHGIVPTQFSTEDNRWNQSAVSHYDIPIIASTEISNIHDNQNAHEKLVNNDHQVPTSLNSHANFPMINDKDERINIKNVVKPVTEKVNEFKTIDQKRPAKLIPNGPINSHGWYSSGFLNENTLNNIKAEVTTRKVIPLSHEYNNENVPDFGHKITSIGKPPSGMWQEKPADQNNYGVGKPFTGPHITENSSTTKHHVNYVISMLGDKQPAYDIPIRDNSYETTTSNVKHMTKMSKPVYEDSEEIYDGEEGVEGNNDGEFSEESMKIPVISKSNEEQTSNNPNFITKEQSKDSPKDSNKQNNVHLVEFNPGTQTEKPFNSSNETTFQTITIRPIYNSVKPSPFAINSPTLDHQLHQPHWQINQLMVNSTNVSYEESLDLNIGEEIDSPSSRRPSSTHKPPKRYQDYENKYRRPQRPTFTVAQNNSRVINSSNIITSTVQINDRKPLIVEDTSEVSKSTPVSFTTIELNKSSSEIFDLSPPPPTLEYSFKPSTNDEMIMGMSPPPPKAQSPVRLPPRNSPTPRPLLPARTPPPYRTLPPRTLTPRKPTTSRPIRRPINRDEISTYRPTYDILNNVHRPSFNRDQPSSHLLPPPRAESSGAITPINELPSPTVHIPNVIFPTPTSSGWLTSSGVGFSSSFDFGPSSVLFPNINESPKVPTSPGVTSTENSYYHEVASSSQHSEETSSEKAVTEKDVFKVSTESISNITASSEEKNLSNSEENESSHEDNTTDRIKVIPIPSKNRTRKPYPVRDEEKKSSTNKYRLPRPTSVIKPTKTLSKPEILYPTRQFSTRKVLRPLHTKPTTVKATLIESSESSLEEDFIKPTEVLKESDLPSQLLEKESTIKNIIENTVTPSFEEVKPTIQATHHAGNEIKIVDEITPTKTEFKTTVVTLTKTLSEPPKTVSSIGYLNLTHTLTVTHTKTSLVSQSEGAVTQTLVLTNTHTSTIVDVVTEIHTQVQPTTIIETVTKHIPIPNVEPTPVHEVPAKTAIPLDHISMSSEEENVIMTDNETTENIQKIEPESEGDTFFVVMNKSQNGGKAPSVNSDIDTGEYDVTRNEQDNNNGVSQVLFGEILLAGTPYLETTNVHTSGVGYGKECQPDCKASRNERCQRIDGMMKCVCRPGFARMFPDRPCKPTYTYSVKLALGSLGNERLSFNESLADNSSKQYHSLSLATHEGINRMVMQSDLRDIFHGIHINGFSPVEVKSDNGELYQGVMNDFYVQLSDNAQESRLKEVIEKYLRNNNYSLGGTDVHAASELVDRLDVSDFDECTSGQFHDCSEHAQCFNLRGTYTCSCLEGYADLSVNSLYPGRICSAEPVGCERCNYHGTCYSRDDRRVLCECFQWYAGSTCHINLKVVLISLVVLGALLTVVLAACAIVACRRPRPPPRSIVTCIQGMPSLHQEKKEKEKPQTLPSSSQVRQEDNYKLTEFSKEPIPKFTLKDTRKGAMPSKQRADRRALISDRGDSGDASSIQNASLPYMPAKRPPASSKKCTISDPPAHDPPPPPPSVMIPRARLHPHHSDSRENISRKKSLELTSPSEAKLISYLESGAANTNEEMRRKHSMESSYSANKDRHIKQGNRHGKGALVSAGFKVSTTVRADEVCRKDDRDDMSSINKNDLEAELRFDSLRKSYSQEELSEWTDAERRIGELTLSEARSIGGTLPASTGRAASSTRLTHQEANTMAERDLGSTFLLPHVHLYKPDLTSDVSEFDSL